MALSHPAVVIGNGKKTRQGQNRQYIQVTLARDPLFCGDDRPLDEPYIQLFGGVINLAYNQAVVEETLHAGSVSGSLKDRVEDLTAACISHGMCPGVHSDVASEHGTELRKHHNEGAVGCAYAEKRPLISESIAELGIDLVDEANRLCPELFEKPEDRAFALGVTMAHGRLAGREGFQAAGRQLVLTAADNGAATVVLTGRHIAGDGIINLDPNTTFDSAPAAKAGLAAYNHDAWAAEAIFERLGTAGDSTPKQRRIANLIDALGTMHVLGVEAIIVRREIFHGNN